MSHLLLDTHVWAWSLTADKRLSARAIAAIEAAETISISAISFYEIGQKTRLGKWPEMLPHLESLIELAEQQGGRLLPVTPSISLVAASIAWDHRDPFDRIIGTTALLDRLELVSADVVFDEFSSLPEWKGRIW